MTTEAKVPNLQELDDLLQCPVCYEVPKAQIFQCNEGHHVCGRCKSRLSQCPVCRALFFGTRNYAMEELIANLKTKFGIKPAFTSGSDSTTSADNSVAGASTIENSLEDDEPTEAPQPPVVRAPPACKGLFRCLCCKNGSSERLPAGRLLNHLRYFHSRDLIEGRSDNGEYLQAWQISTSLGKIVICVRVADMGVFFLVMEINKDCIYSWVSVAAAPWVANQYIYTITLSGNDREAIFTDCVWSVRACEGALKKRGRALTVIGANVRAFLSGNTMNAKLSLRRAAGDSLDAVQPRSVLRVADRAVPAAEPVAAPQRGEPQRGEPVIGRDLVNSLRQNDARFPQLHSHTDAARPAAARPAATRPAAAQPAVESAPAAAPPREMSRNARRRQRTRLRAALTPPEPASPSPSISERIVETLTLLAQRHQQEQQELPQHEEGPSHGNPPRANRKKRRQRR